MEEKIIRKVEVTTNKKNFEGTVSLVLVQKENGWTYEVEDMSHGNLPLTWRTRTPEQASKKLEDIYSNKIWNLKIIE